MNGRPSSLRRSVHNPAQCIVAPKAFGSDNTSSRKQFLPRSEVCSVDRSRPYTDMADWSVRSRSSAHAPIEAPQHEVKKRC